MGEKFTIFRFVARKVQGFTPDYFTKQGIFSGLSFLETMWIIYFPSLLLTLLDRFNTLYSFLPLLLLVLSVLPIFRALAAYVNQKVILLKMIIEQKFFEEVGLASFNIRFDLLENPEFVRLKEEAMFPIETQDVVNRLVSSAPLIVQSFLSILGIMSIMLFLDSTILLIFIILGLLNFVINRKIVSNERNAIKKVTDKNSEYIYYLRTIRNGKIAEDVRVYGLVNFLDNKIKVLFDYIGKAISRYYFIGELRGIVNKVISVSIIAFSYIYLLDYSIQNVLDASQLILVINASITFSSEVNTILNEILVTNQQLDYLKAYYDFSNTIESEKQIEEKTEDKEISSIKTIKFEQVSFKYPGSENYVLNDLSFEIGEKQNISLVGLNGSGKTTIVKLLTKLYQPTSGRILINGLELQQIKTENYLTNIATVFQDFKIYSYSVRENIVLNKEVNEEKFNESLISSNLNEELGKFPNGVETYVSDHLKQNSINLSKGQEQKLAIARAIYNEGSFLILDEPTASLDPIAEEETYKNFMKFSENKLAFFISHRLSHCKYSDNILFIEEGRIIESGTHSQLMKLKNRYHALYSTQAENYKLTG